MSPDEFIALAIRTAPTEYPYFTSKLVEPDILHAWLGVTTECGESGDVIKKALIYGKEPDLINLDEEFGDKLWYIALYCWKRKITFSDLFDSTIAKLQKRFPEKFTENEAINRDVVAERAVLESYAKDDDASFDMILTRDYIKRFNIKPTIGAFFRYTPTGQDFQYQGENRWEALNATPLR